MASSDSTLYAWRRGKGPDAEEVIFGTNCHNLSNKPLKISESPFFFFLEVFLKQNNETTGSRWAKPCPENRGKVPAETRRADTGMLYWATCGVPNSHMKY